MLKFCIEHCIGRPWLLLRQEKWQSQSLISLSTTSGIRSPSYWVVTRGGLQMLRNVAKSYLNRGDTLNHSKTKCGIWLYVNSISHSFPPKINNNAIKHSDVDQLLDHLKELDEISYQALWDVPADFLGFSNNNTSHGNPHNQDRAVSLSNETFQRRKLIVQNASDSSSDNTQFSDCSETGKRILPATNAALSHPQNQPSHWLVSTMMGATSNKGISCKPDPWCFL